MRIPPGIVWNMQYDADLQFAKCTESKMA